MWFEEEGSLRVSVGIKRGVNRIFFFRVNFQIFKIIKQKRGVKR